MSLYNPNYPATTSAGWTDQYGNFVSYPSAAPAPVSAVPDWRDNELNLLRMELVNKETSLREAYMEIGRLHEQLRGLTAFDKWSDDVKKHQPMP